MTENFDRPKRSLKFFVIITPLPGIAVNIAARALEKCPGNGVVITKNLRDLLGRSKFSVTSIGDFTLKGLEGNWELFKVENGQ